VGPVKLLYVGRLVRTKGARELIRAMALTQDLDCRLDIVGDGPDREANQALITELHLEDRVTLWGWKSKAEVSAFYRDADVFVFPSYREPGGTVVHEAMGFSLPLVVADRGGPGSNVSPECGIKLPISTPAALVADIASAVKFLVNDPVERRRMGAAAYAHVGGTSLWRKKLDRIDTLYAQISRPN
jgi:glycosyltransferase involved in cell wall biosynthesis